MAPKPSTVRIRARQNVTIGGVFVAVDEEGDVPDVPELHDAIRGGIVEAIDAAKAKAARKG